MREYKIACIPVEPRKGEGRIDGAPFTGAEPVRVWVSKPGWAYREHFCLRHVQVAHPSGVDEMHLDGWVVDHIPTGLATYKGERPGAASIDTCLRFIDALASMPVDWSCADPSEIERQTMPAIGWIRRAACAAASGETMIWGAL